MPAGGIGLDLQDTSFATVERCLLRYHEIGIHGKDGGLGGGQYVEIGSCELTSCKWGMYLESAANAWRVFGGRIHGNVEAGVYVTGSSGVCLSSTFESNAIGVHFATGAEQCSVTASYFEEQTTAAVQFDAGASHNTESYNTLADGSDVVLDLDGRNGSQSLYAPSFPAARTGLASGRNLLSNPSFDVDSNGDGLADGLEFTPNAAHLTLSLDTGVSIGGYTGTSRSKSQKFAVNDSGASNRSILKQIAVVPGRTYTLTGWVKCTGAAQFRVSAESVATSRDLFNSGVLAAAGWQLLRATFVPTAETLRLYADNVAGAGVGALWLDEFTLEAGQLSSESTAGEALDHTETLGPVLASASTIAPTHAVHHVSGTAAISTIAPAPGFSGRALFIPDGPWTSTTGGNVANFVQARTSVPILAAYDSQTGLWYLTGDIGESFVPTKLGNAVLWLRADKGITVSSGAVTAWADQSAGGHGAVVGAGNLVAPTYHASDANFGGRPSLSFNGTTQGLTLGAIDLFGAGAAVASVFAVYLMNDANASRPVIGRSATAFSWFFGNDYGAATGKFYFYGKNSNTGVGAIGTSDTHGAPHVAVGTFNANVAVTRLFLDGAEQTDGGTGFVIPSTSDDVGIGALVDGAHDGVAGGYASCAIAEIAAFSTELKPTDVAALQAYAVRRYGLG